ncbi:MAG TPA: hypothetical protein VF718_06780 [Allosphingosinicella sp.]
MSRLLTLMMILVLVMAHGSSVAAAICRHQDGVEHAFALRSDDAGVSAAAYSEESAAKAGLRKGAPVDSGAAASPADLLPAPELPVPFRAKEAAERTPADAPRLAGVSMCPLLEPPSA